MSSQTIKIAVIRGDGIGVEVVEEGLKVLSAVADRIGLGLEFTEFPWGSNHYFETGAMMPASALETLADFDAIYLGAVGHPEIQDHITLNELLLPIRRRFDQYVCLRPNTLFPGIESPLRTAGPLCLLRSALRTAVSFLCSARLARQSGFSDRVERLPLSSSTDCVACVSPVGCKRAQHLVRACSRHAWTDLEALLRSRDIVARSELQDRHACASTRKGSNPMVEPPVGRWATDGGAAMCRHGAAMIS